MATKLIDRQTVLAALADLRVANMGAGNEITMAIPVGALVTAVRVVTVTAFDAATAATATVTDGTTVYANAVDVKTTGSETVANAPKFYPSGGTITASLAQTGTSTVGRVLVEVEYVVVNRGGEIAH